MWSMPQLYVGYCILIFEIRSIEMDYNTKLTLKFFDASYTLQNSNYALLLVLVFSCMMSTFLIEYIYNVCINDILSI